jgi:hypothetical protein
MLHRKSLCLALLACFPALPAQADNVLSSSYLDAAYLNSSLDAGGPAEDEVEGFRVATSVALLPYLNFVADYDKRRYQDAHDGFAAVGFAGHTMDPAWQAFIAATYERASYDDNKSSTGDHDEEGYGVEGGFRAAASVAEFHASYKYFALGEVAPGVALTGARYGGGVAIDLTPWWSLTGDYRIRSHEFEDSNTGTTAEAEWTEWSVGLRRYFVTQTDRRNRSGGVLTALTTALFGEDDSAQ